MKHGIKTTHKLYIMKNISTYISEKLKISSTNSNPTHTYVPKSFDELKDIVTTLKDQRGNDADLNDIDTSNITDMKRLFKNEHDIMYDISEWNVSNVEDMRYMFANCSEFNSDISGWDVSKVTDMSYMFGGCESFDQDLSNWDVHNVNYMNCILQTFLPYFLH